MNIKKFSNISLRGRVAFALLCLEEAIDKFGDQNSTWNLVLKKLWAFTDTKFISEWQKMLAECIPGVILCNNYSDEFELITKTEFSNLESMYKNTNVNLCKIVDSIFDIGSIELFDEGIEGDSDGTLKSLGVVIDLCEHNKITMPSPDIVKKFNFHEYGGWGERFDRDDISLLNRANP